MQGPQLFLDKLQNLALQAYVLQVLEPDVQVPRGHLQRLRVATGVEGLNGEGRSFCLLVHLPDQLGTLDRVDLAHVGAIEPPEHLELLVMVFPVLVVELESLREMVHFRRVSLFNNDLDDVFP